MHGSCPRGKNCTFAHSIHEIETYRHKRTTLTRPHFTRAANVVPTSTTVISNEDASMVAAQNQPPPIARVGPVPRENIVPQPQTIQTNVLVRPQAAVTPMAFFDMQSGQPVAVQQVAVQPVQVQVPMQMTEIGFQGHQPQSQPQEIQSQPPMMDDHAEEIQINLHQTTPVGEMKPDVVGEKTQTLATKSLSALRNRKEQIKDTLEDMIGKDEMERLTQQSQEMATSGKSAGAPLFPAVVTSLAGSTTANNRTSYSHIPGKYLVNTRMSINNRGIRTDDNLRLLTKIDFKCDAFGKSMQHFLSKIAN